jgi:hypothetical protein
VVIAVAFAVLIDLDVGCLFRMNELCFVPTPNWFVSKPLDVYFNDDLTSPNSGLVAFGVIGTIYFADHRFEKFHGSIKDAHLKRLNALAFNKNSNESCLLASCGEDLEVKIWNATTRTLVTSHQLHQVKARKLKFPDLCRSPFGHSTLTESIDLKN